MTWENLGYELTIKEIDKNARYEAIELAGLSGLGIEKVVNLIAAGTLPSDSNKRVLGSDFLNWVRQSGVPVRKQQ
jgi:hypothetical protein